MNATPRLAAATLCLLTLSAALPASGRAAEAARELSAWQGWQGAGTGDWKGAGGVGLAATDPATFAIQAGAGVLVNGERGRTDDLFTRTEHGDVAAHVEFVVPRGSNSGVYFMGRYELQVLDSWDGAAGKPKQPITSGDCGGIYERWDPRRGKGKEGYEGHAPRVNAARPPGEWQSFDVVFRAPRFTPDGRKAENARFVKVYHNGVLVHDDVPVTGPTRASPFAAEAAAGPLMLQGDHGPVAYRNIRLRPLVDAGAEFPQDRLDESGFVAIFDGTTLAGWHPSPKTGHSRASGNTTAGRWVVEGGAIVGSQDIPGNGGIVITDRSYGDFEVAVEMRNDFGPDSGLFLRSTETGSAYQYLVDYHDRGNLAGLYGERISPGFHIRNFSFGDTPAQIAALDAPFPLPVAPAAWPRFWKHGVWNELRARIEGNPPHITTWINGVRFMEWVDPMKRHPDRGGIALQVHGGGDSTRQFVRYRNIRVKELGP